MHIRDNISYIPMTSWGNIINKQIPMSYSTYETITDRFMSTFKVL